jgi:putative spermidine/putrescine transport system permease protein
MSDAILTPIEKKPIGFTAGVLAAAGGFAGLFLGTAQGSGLMGIVIGAALMAALAVVAMQMLGEAMEKPVRWGLIALGVAAGFMYNAIPGLIMGGLFGWFFGWFIYWIGMAHW